MIQIKEIVQKDKILNVLKTKRKVVLITLLLSVVFLAYFINGKYIAANPGTLYTLVKVEKRDLVKSISVNGEIVSTSEVELGADISGQITAVYVNIGQLVRGGEIIAQIENRTQKAQVTQTLGTLQASRAHVQSAEALLEKVINGSSQEDKNIASSQVSAAESVALSAQDTARNALQNAYAGTVSALSFGTDVSMQNTSTVNPTLKFQTTEYSAKIATENKRVKAGDILTRHSSQSAYDLDKVTLVTELQDTKEELIVLRELTDSLLIAIGGAITTSTVPADTINSYTTTVSNARNQIIANITALTSAQNAIISADKALHTVQENKNKVLGGIRTEDIDVAKANVGAAKASVLSASGNYQIAKAALDRTYIYSPRSGIVVDIYKEVGEFASNSIPIVKISSEDRQISALVSEVDIAKVRVGMKAIIKLDALPDKVFTGFVDFIYPDKQEVLGIVYYEINVSSDSLQESDFTILPGMSLDVTIPYETKKDAFAIERNVAKKDGKEYFVQILNPDKKKPIDEKFTKIFFKNGFVGDKYVEVLSGLSHNVGVVKFIDENKGKK